MSEELIGDFLDRKKFVDDIEFALAALKRFTDKIDEVNSAKKVIAGATTFKAVTESADQGVKANTALADTIRIVASASTQRMNAEKQLNTTLTESIQLRTRYQNTLASLKKDEKENYDLLQRGTITEDEYKKRLVESTLAMERYKQRISEVSKEIKAQQALQLATPNTAAAVKAENKVLTIQRDVKTDLNDQARIAEINSLLDKNNALLRENSDELTKQKINIGNYEGSAKIIVDALEKEKKKLEELQKVRMNVQNAGASFNPTSNVAASRTTVTGFAGGGASASGITALGSAANASEKDIEALDNEIEKSRKIIEGFSRVTEAPQFLNIAAKAGDANKEVRFFTKALIDMERQGQGNSAAAIELRKHLAELTDEIGDAKAEIKALSSDTRGFDLFAGSVTFAADAMQTLAGASVLAGASEEDAAEATKSLVAIQSVANGVKGIATELTTRGTAANKLYAFSQTQIKIAMDSTATGAARLRAAMLTIGFGALIVGIGLLIANFSKIKDALTGATTATKAYTETLADYEKGASEAVVKTNQVKVAFDEAKAGVISKKEALKIYNDTLGDTFGKATSLTQAEDLYTKKAPEYIRIMGLKAQANALFAKSADATAKGLVAANQDQVSILDKFKLSLTREAFLSGISAEQLAKQQADNVKKIKEAADKDAKSLLDKAEQLQMDADKSSKKLDIDFNKPEAVKKTPKDDSALKDALELEKRKNAAIRALEIENANEIIRINQGIVDSESTGLKDKVLALGAISTQRKIISGIEFTGAVEDEAKIEKGKRVEIQKSNEEILLAKAKFKDQSAAIDDEQAKNTEAAQKASSAKILAEYDRVRQEKIKKLDDETQATRDQQEKEYNDSIIALNDRFASGKIGLEAYNKKRADLEVGFHTDSLQREIDYQKKLLEIIDLPEADRAAALRQISQLEMELSDAVKDHHIKNEQEKLDSTLKALQGVQNTATTVFGFIDGLLAANETAQKNRIADSQKEAEKTAAHDIDVINQSGMAEEEKAARIMIVNQRLQAQKDKYAAQEKKAEEDRAKFQKATAIFNIILTTTQAVIKAFAEGDPYTKVARAAIAAAEGAAQLAVAIATPVPRFYRGKKKGEAYEGIGMVNDHPDGRTMEVIERADGRIEMPSGRNVITHIGANDIIYPSKEQWVEDVLNAAYRDAQRMMPPSQARGQKDPSLHDVMDKHTGKIVNAIKNKPELYLGASDKGMEAIWMWGSNKVRYINENTNW